MRGGNLGGIRDVDEPDGVRERSGFDEDRGDDDEKGCAPMVKGDDDDEERGAGGERGDSE